MNNNEFYVIVTHINIIILLLLLFYRSHKTKRCLIRVLFCYYRDKNLRLQSIHEKVINFMGMNDRELSPSPIIKNNPSSKIPIQQRDAIRMLYDNLNNFPSYPSDTFTEKTQSFYPSCKSNL